MEGLRWCSHVDRATHWHCSTYKADVRATRHGIATVGVWRDYGGAPMWVAQITGIATLTMLIWYDPSTVAFPER